VREPYGSAFLVCLTGGLRLHNVSMRSNSCQGQVVFALTSSKELCSFNT